MAQDPRNKLERNLKPTLKEFFIRSALGIKQVNI